MAQGPDFTKREAKKSLWDLDGQHEDKRYRKKGRSKDKELIKHELKDLDLKDELDLHDMLDKEAEEAWDCHMYGPCERCLAREEQDGSIPDIS